MMSEMYYPAWKAYVDGHPVPLYSADYMLRAVPVPAGDHTVELRYESPSLTAGIVISLVFCATLVALVVAKARTSRTVDPAPRTPSRRLDHHHWQLASTARDPVPGSRHR